MKTRQAVAAIALLIAALLCLDQTLLSLAARAAIRPISASWAQLGANASSEDDAKRDRLKRGPFAHLGEEKHLEQQAEVAALQQAQAKQMQEALLATLKAQEAAQRAQRIVNEAHQRTLALAAGRADL
eukprot:4070826-Prymnesium_polylepis.1